MIIKLIRHGQSEANTGEASPQEVGDHTINLTSLGQQQAREVGKRVGSAYVRDALIYTSPYQRTRQTLSGLLAGAEVERDSVPVYEDPRLREVEHGYQDIDAQEEDRNVHGWFYYRFQGGESPADCFDRTSGFIDSLLRQAARKKRESALVVTHGLTIRCFVMRFLHLTVEQFESIANPTNCAVITLAPKETIANPLFSTSQWSLEGLKLRDH